MNCDDAVRHIALVIRENGVYAGVWPDANKYINSIAQRAVRITDQYPSTTTFEAEHFQIFGQSNL